MIYHIHVCSKNYDHRGECRCVCGFSLGMRPADSLGLLSCGGLNR